jgi:hypothetical protein
MGYVDCVGNRGVFTGEVMQTKSRSLIESVTSTAIGLVINTCLNIVIFKCLSIPVTLVQNMWVAVIFTVVSILRQYIVRRCFNSKEV